MNRFDVDYQDEERGIQHFPCEDGEYVLADDAIKAIEQLQAGLELATELIDALNEHEGSEGWSEYMFPMLEAWYATCSTYTPEDKT